MSPRRKLRGSQRSPVRFALQGRACGEPKPARTLLVYKFLNVLLIRLGLSSGLIRRSLALRDDLRLLACANAFGVGRIYVGLERRRHVGRVHRPGVVTHPPSRPRHGAPVPAAQSRPNQRLTTPPLALSGSSSATRLPPPTSRDHRGTHTTGEEARAYPATDAPYFPPSHSTCSSSCSRCTSCSKPYGTRHQRANSATPTVF